jgi:hypothetical protein
VEDPQNCSFEGLVYRETLKGGPEQPISLTVVNNRVVSKSSNDVWAPPEKGFVKFVFQEVVAMPSVDDAISAHYLDLLMKIVEAGRESDKKKDVDKKRVWLYLLCQDVYLTTAQVTYCWRSFCVIQLLYWVDAVFLQLLSSQLGPLEP